MTSFAELKRKDAIDTAVEQLLERRRRAYEEAHGRDPCSTTSAIQTASRDEITRARLEVIRSMGRATQARINAKTGRSQGQPLTPPSRTASNRVNVRFIDRVLVANHITDLDERRALIRELAKTPHGSPVSLPLNGGEIYLNRDGTCSVSRTRRSKSSVETRVVRPSGQRPS